MKSEIFSVIDDISVNMTNIKGKTIDISRMMVSFEIYENIFDFFLTGKIIIVDTLDLPQHFPIIGNENVEVSLTTTDSNKTKIFNFKIYKYEKDIKNIRGVEKKRILVLYLCSDEYLKNNINLISKKFSGTPDSVIDDVLNELGTSKQCDSESGISNIEIFSNFWTAQKIIDFVCKISESSLYKDYVFFETLDGFVFKTLSNLMNQPSIADFVYSTDIESIINSNNIKTFKMNSYFDLNMNSKNGLFGNTFYKPHDTEYSFQKIEESLTDNVENLVTHGKSLPYDVNMASENNLVGVNWYNPEISSVRLASIKLLQNYNLVVRMNGDFSRKTGDVINLEYPNFDNENNINTSFDGKWFIAGIKHSILQTNEYEQNVLLVKNAFFKNNDLEDITLLNNL